MSNAKWDFSARIENLEQDVCRAQNRRALLYNEKVIKEDANVDMDKM
jgi:hypothetical protein